LVRAATHNLFKALSDPTRRALFEQLSRGGEQSVHALTARSGVSQPAVSKHLRQLKRTRLVRCRREGRETHYSANLNALEPLLEWINFYGAFWEDSFDKLENLLKRMNP
jgi:DNA-binding transcriptional ArsR family regulator